MNLFEETLVAVRLHGLDGAAGLRLATLEGARALGIETGSLTPGKWADLALVEADVGGDEEDAERAVLEAAAGGGVMATVVGGSPVYDRIETG